jgi:DNA invertase Pin-like site-specific DNA recombinase
LETEKLNRIRQSVEDLAKTAESLTSDADDFPAVLQNTKRLSACIRMMEMALGQVTMSSEKHR